MKFGTRMPKQGQQQEPNQVNEVSQLIKQLPPLETEVFELEELVDLGQTPASGGDTDGTDIPPHLF